MVSAAELLRQTSATLRKLAEVEDTNTEYTLNLTELRKLANEDDC